MSVENTLSIIKPDAVKRDLTGKIIATVHQITKELDNGPILGQVVVKIAENTTAKKMEKDLLPKEHLLYKTVLREFLKEKGRKILLIDPEVKPQN